MSPCDLLMTPCFFRPVSVVTTMRYPSLHLLSALIPEPTTFAAAATDRAREAVVERLTPVSPRSSSGAWSARSCGTAASTALRNRGATTASTTATSAGTLLSTSCCPPTPTATQHIHTGTLPWVAMGVFPTTGR